MVTLQAVFDRVHDRLHLGSKGRETVEVEPFPFASTHYTTETRRGHLGVRVHDLLLQAPTVVQESVAAVVLAQHYKVPYRPSLWRDYLAWRHRPEVLTLAQQCFLARDRTITGSPKGEHYDLAEVFADVNAVYFRDQVPTPGLTWTKRESRRTFGSYIGDLHTIVMNRVLDDSRIPRFVLDSVLYHEMLHISVDTLELLGRTIHHSAQFKWEERRFIRQEEAEKWLANLAIGRVGGRSRRPAR